MLRPDVYVHGKHEEYRHRCSDSGKYDHIEGAQHIGEMITGDTSDRAACIEDCDLEM